MYFTDTDNRKNTFHAQQRKCLSPSLSPLWCIFTKRKNLHIPSLKYTHLFSVCLLIFTVASTKICTTVFSRSPPLKLLQIISNCRVKKSTYRQQKNMRKRTASILPLHSFSLPRYNPHLPLHSFSCRIQLFSYPCGK